MLTKEMIVKAAQMTFVWRNVYNSLCKPCRLTIVKTALEGNRMKAEQANERMQKALENLCIPCKEKVREILSKVKQ